MIDGMLNRADGTPPSNLSPACMVTKGMAPKGVGGAPPLHLWPARMVTTGMVTREVGGAPPSIKLCVIMWGQAVGCG